MGGEEDEFIPMTNLSLRCFPRRSTEEQPTWSMALLDTHLLASLQNILPFEISNDNNKNHRRTVLGGQVLFSECLSVRVHAQCCLVGPTSIPPPSPPE